MLRFLRQSTDAEHVKRLSKKIEFWDQWRVVILVVFVTLIIGVFGFLGWAINLLINIPPNNPLGINLNFLYLCIAFVFGATFGLHLSGIMNYVIPAALGGLRTERLLVKLYAETYENSNDRK